MRSGGTSFSQLCSLAPAPDERELAIRMAWEDSYDQLPGKKIERTFTTLLLGFSGLLFVIWGAVLLLVAMSYSGGFWPATTGMFFLILGSVCFKFKGSKEQQPWTENISINHKRHQLQSAGEAFLKDRYEEWLKKGREEFGATIRQVIGGDEILYSESILAVVPEQNIHSTKAENYVRPSFSKPKRFYIWGYLITPQKLVMVPDFAAKATSGCTVASAIRSWVEETATTTKECPVLDLYQTAIQTVRLNSETANFPVLKWSGLSFAEVFFAEMVSMSYSGIQGTMGKMTITARDGRTLVLLANQGTADAVRDAMNRART